MNLNKTTSYTLKVLNHMAVHENEVQSAHTLHKELKIPRQYLRQLLTSLTKNGFIKSISGRAGGFVFNKSIDKIYILDIIKTLEGTDFLDKCILGFEKCPFDDHCALHDTWSTHRNRITEVLRNTSLADLARNKK
jgi:Rrf2 family protein